jgi:hypothetical protein
MLMYAAELVARSREMEVIPWEDPEEITVVERQLDPAEFEAIRKRIEEATP